MVTGNAILKRHPRKFLLLCDRLNVSGAGEATVTVRTRTGWRIMDEGIGWNCRV